MPALKRPLRTILFICSFRICPRLPRKYRKRSCGNSSGVRQFTGSMGRSTPPWFSPSRPKTEVSLCCSRSSPYAGYCPATTDRLSPLMLLPAAGSYLMTVYAVVKVLFHSVTTGGRYDYILKRKWTTAVGLAGPFDGPHRPISITDSLRSSTVETQQIAAAC